MTESVSKLSSTASAFTSFMSGRNTETASAHPHPWLAQQTFVQLLLLVPFRTDLTPRYRGSGLRRGHLFAAGLWVLQPGWLWWAVNDQHVAGLWHRLTRAGLVTNATELRVETSGPGIATFMAMKDPMLMIGIHLKSWDMLSLYRTRGAATVPQCRKTYLERNGDSGGRNMATRQSNPRSQSTRIRRRLAAVLAAWILEKWRSWADSDEKTRSAVLVISS